MFCFLAVLPLKFFRSFTFQKLSWWTVPSLVVLIIGLILGDADTGGFSKLGVEGASNQVFNKRHFCGGKQRLVIGANY